ncbi:MAG: putative protein serine/threonine kinase [Streblomastix strix]|uniref:non-specific serine/threonine protein kinase n=1 Tax=Streblomastix strix TaxID=222440 RepID=A0A5J4WNC4_9EUKA|nr:MAG: putative protein serine/threonine kinase [Streblomastix strix]
MPKQSDYQIIRALGHGAFGTTFLISEKATGQQCAWKRITITSDEDRRLAQLELEMLQRVRGDNLVQLLGSFEDKYEFFILMEYCDRGDLRKYMNGLVEKGESIDEEDVWNLLAQMIEALHCLHGMDIIHRDLKPENVFLTGENNQVKIGDFGLARIALQTQQYYTKVGGTTVYFSPELLDEDEDDDSSSGSEEETNNTDKKQTFIVVQTKESDIFALGEICYELITLKHPFADKKGKITNKRIRNCQVKQLPSHISEPLKQVVMMMLNKDPVRRPTTEQLLSNPEIARRIQQLKIRRITGNSNQEQIQSTSQTQSIQSPQIDEDTSEQQQQMISNQTTQPEQLQSSSQEQLETNTYSLSPRQQSGFYSISSSSSQQTQNSDNNINIQRKEEMNQNVQSSDQNKEGKKKKKRNRKKNKAKQKQAKDNDEESSEEENPKQLNQQEEEQNGKQNKDDKSSMCPFCKKPFSEQELELHINRNHINKEKVKFTHIQLPDNPQSQTDITNKQKEQLDKDQPNIKQIIYFNPQQEKSNTENEQQQVKENSDQQDEETNEKDTKGQISSQKKNKKTSGRARRRKAKKEKQIQGQKLSQEQEEILQKVVGRLQMFYKILEDLKSTNLKLQENACAKLNNLFEHIEDDEGRLITDKVGIVDQLLHIYATCDLKSINRNFTHIFNSLTHPSKSYDFRKQLYRKNIFASLVRLFDHSDDMVAVDGIVSIFHILCPTVQEKNQSEVHPHYEAMLQCDGINKIFKLFQRTENKPHRDFAAVSLGILFRMREMENVKMRREIIEFLRSRLKMSGYWIKDIVNFALCSLARNQVNLDEILKDNILITIKNKMKQELIEKKDRLNQMNELFNDQLYYCDLLIAVLYMREDDSLRQQLVDLSLIDSLLHIFATRDLRNIPRPYSELFSKIVDRCNNKIKQQIFNRKPYPSLVRLLSSPEKEVIEYSLFSICEILKYGIETAKSPNDPNPHFDTVKQCGGIDKIYEIVNKGVSPQIIQHSACAIGYLHKQRKIENRDMAQRVILALLMNNKKSPEEKHREEAAKVLDILEQNKANCEQIMIVIQSFPQLLDEDNKEDWDEEDDDDDET